MRKPRVVVSTLQLEPRKPQHASLLRNMITYCAAGWPEVAVVEDEAGGRGADIARKLRVQGANAVELPLAAPGPLRFEEWPLRGVHEVLVDETWEPDAVLGADEAKKWLELGNTLVRLEGDRLTLRQGASDAHVVAQRWSAWFHGVEPALWHGGLDRDGADRPGSIFGTRAILRMLLLLQRESTRAQPDRLGLEPPVHYSEPVLSLLTRRWQSSPSFEGTISTHTAAHDVLQLIGGANVAPDVAAYIEEWLRGACQDAASEDRLDIARCLGDKQIFRNVVGELGPKPLSAVLATRLRESAVACGLEPELEAPQLEELPPSDLENNLLLAGEYVAARVAFSQVFRGHAWSKLDDRAMSRALAAIGKFGVLARASVEGVALDTVLKPPGEISTEARALIAYYNLDPSSTHAIRREAQGVPAAMVEAVLKTSNRARAAEAAAQAAEEKVRQTLSAREANLRRAQNVFGFAAAIAAVIFFGLMIVVIGHDLAGITAAFGLGAFFFIVVSLPLHLFRLAPDWTGQVASTIGGGFAGLAANLAKLFRSGAERE
jgi:hypothetical protein